MCLVTNSFIHPGSNFSFFVRKFLITAWNSLKVKKITVTLAVDNPDYLW